MEGHAVRAEIAQLNRPLLDYERLLQEAGLKPKITPAARDAKGEGGSAVGNAVTQELAVLVNRFVNMPSEEFMPALVALLDPPPVKQPPTIEGTVIERRTLTEADDETP